jgi:signal transduction histidine kinase
MYAWPVTTVGDVSDLSDAPEADRAGPEQLRRLLAAVLSLNAGLDLREVLYRIAEAAVDLVGARYGALGVLSPDRSHLSAFLTVGLDEGSQRRIGDLPHGHGILGLLIVEPTPIRLDDLNAHAEAFGFPAAHPPMTSFLGVPVFVEGQAYGNLYLTDKLDGTTFSEADEELVVGLAAAAGVAIDNARLHARARQVDLAADRERIARDLHDTVIQRLFAVGLSLQGAARAAEKPEVSARIEAAVDDLDETVREVRASIFELAPPAMAADGLRRQLVTVGDELLEALGATPTFRFDGAVDSAVPDELVPHVVAVVREGLANVARHAGSPTAAVRVSVADGDLTVMIDDQGRGGATQHPTGRGLVNLDARAASLGGTFEVIDRPTGGTRAIWRVPLPV